MDVNVKRQILAIISEEDLCSCIKVGIYDLANASKDGDLRFTDGVDTSSVRLFTS